jgi:hypothetical protein
LLLLLVLMLASAALPGSAGAAQTDKPYEVRLTPATVQAGAPATIAATFSNPAGARQQLGSANLTVPAGLTARSASVASPGTASVSGQTVEVRNLSLQPGRSVTIRIEVEVTVRASCTATVLTWAVQAKQANDFQGLPGNDLTLLASSSLTTTVSGVCALRFVTQPANSRVGEPITGTPYGPGQPVSVELVDGAGDRVSSPSTEVTIALGSGSGPGTLTGTKTVDTNADGVARFADLKIGAPGGYSLEATAPGLAPVTSTSFKIDTVASFCAENTADALCTVTTSTGQTGASVTATPSATSADAGFLTLSFNAGPQFDCVGSPKISPDIALLDFTSPNRTKVATLIFNKRLMQRIANNGASFLEVCFASPVPFPVKGGLVELSRTQGTFDWNGDGLVEPVYAGLLPDCSARTPPCVANRKKTGAGDGVIEARLPAGDPAMRG